MGVDAIPLGAVSCPPLTSVVFDAKTIVDAAVPAMMAELGYPTLADVEASDPAGLIVRDTT